MRIDNALAPVRGHFKPVLQMKIEVLAARCSAPGEGQNGYATASRSDRLRLARVASLAGLAGKRNQNLTVSGLKPQRVRRRRRYRLLSKWQGKGFAVVPVSPLVAVVRAQRVTRLAHGDVLGGRIHV